MELTELDKRILGALEEGIPVGPSPYMAIAARAGCHEVDVIESLHTLGEEGVLKRLGLVVRHHELGYRANAMVVWDIPDDDVPAIAGRLADEPSITLCYRRPRQLPQWPYNLFCMIHGRVEEEVLRTLEEITKRHGLGHIPKETLFSKRRFKQRGARYCAPIVRRCA